MITLCSGGIQGVLMSGNLWAVLSIENGTVKMGRLQEGLQGNGGLGPVS